MTDIWRFILEQLNDGKRVMLMVVTGTKGSSPGKKGFKMAVSGSGQLFGSIGGGVMEYNMVELARQRLADNAMEVFLKRQVHSADAGEAASGLICAGEQMHAFVPLGAADIAMVESLIELRDQGEACILHIDPSGIHVEGKGLLQVTDTDDKESVEPVAWTYTEEIRPADTVYIFGGGHISIPLSQVCNMTGFRVVVLDNRADLNTMENNTWADSKRIIDYSEAAKHIAHPPTSYICIMTVSHASDQHILEQMVPLPVKYLGMIGSKNKVRKIFSNLQSKGVRDEALRRIDAPMGLEIKSESPEEIAVSIAGQLIMVRRGASTD